MTEIGQILNPMSRVWSGIHEIEINVKDEYSSRHAITRHEINNDTKRAVYCGIAVVSALTGVPVSDVLALIRKQRGKPRARVSGTYIEELIAVLSSLGYEAKLRYSLAARTRRRYLSMKTWLSRHKRHPCVGYIIGQLGIDGRAGHWVVVHGNKYLCSITGTWVSISDAPTLRAKVDVVVAVSKS